MYRGLYWKKVPPHEVDGSLWENVIDLIPEGLATFDAEELEASFGNRGTTRMQDKDKETGSSGKGGSGGKEYVSLLDHKRATNAGIALARLGIPHGGGLGGAILALDEEKLCLSKCSALLAIAPTAEETELLRAYDGDTALLGSTERYFFELIAVPRLVPRLRSWVTKMRFHQQAAELLERQAALRASFEVMLTSEALHVALGLILALGNALNAGTARAGAFGFRIDATLEAIGTSRASSSSSVVGFLARHAARTSPDLAARVAKATRGLAPSVRLDPSELDKELTTMRSDLKACENALKAHESAEAAKERAEQKRREEVDAAARAAVHAAMEAARMGRPVAVDLPGTSAAPAEISDRFTPVMSEFVAEATAKVREMEEGAAALDTAAAKVCTFLCEREEASVTIAHTLLCRLHTFATGLVAAHEQAESERLAQAGKEAKANEQRVTRSSRRAAEKAAAGGEDFEASEASLRAIMEDGDGHADARAEARRETSGRRLTHRRESANAPKSPDELQALFTRRATMGTMEKGSSTRSSRAAQQQQQPPCSPGKRPRRSLTEGDAADEESSWLRKTVAAESEDDDEDDEPK